MIISYLRPDHADLQCQAANSLEPLWKDQEASQLWQLRRNSSAEGQRWARAREGEQLLPQEQLPLQVLALLLFHSQPASTGGRFKMKEIIFSFLCNTVHFRKALPSGQQSPMHRGTGYIHA